MAKSSDLKTGGVQRRSFLFSTLAGGIASTLPAGPGEAALVRRPGADIAITAQTTEGPYYLPLDLMRANIREDLPGIALDIALTVLDQTGEPYAGALVDIWHCDASGAYSGFAQPGESTSSDRTFLRGTQTVDPSGLVIFHSVYPGWYPGRTPHIHFKVRRGELTNLTSQFFLPDALSEFLYTQVPAYRRATLRDTLNSSDGIAIEAGGTVLGSVREGGGRYVASLTVKVDRSANPPIDRPPGPPPGGPRPRLGPGHEASPQPVPDTLSGDARIAALLPDAPRAARHPGPPPGWKQSRQGSAKD